MSAQRFDGKTGRWLAPHTPEQAREEALRTVEANKRWLRDQVWWRRCRREILARFWLLVEHRRPLYCSDACKQRTWRERNKP